MLDRFEVARTGTHTWEAYTWVSWALPAATYRSRRGLRLADADTRLFCLRLRPWGVVRIV